MTRQLTGPARLSARAHRALTHHRVTDAELARLLDHARALRRASTVLLHAPDSDLRVLLDQHTGEIRDAWRGARHDGPWRTATRRSRTPRRRPAYNSAHTPTRSTP